MPAPRPSHRPGQQRHHRIEKISAPLPDRGAHAVRIAEAEPIEIVLRGTPLEIVELVHREHDRSSRLTKPIGDRAVHRIDAFRSIDDEEHEIGLVEGELYLLADRAVHRIVGVGNEPARIHQPEVPPVPLARLRSDGRASCPGCDETIARRPPRIRLKRVDFPVLGRPTIATVGLLTRPPEPAERRRSPSRALISNGIDSASASKLMLSMNKASSFSDSPGSSARSRCVKGLEGRAHRRAGQQARGGDGGAEQRVHDGNELEVRAGHAASGSRTIGMSGAIAVPVTIPTRRPDHSARSADASPIRCCSQRTAPTPFSTWSNPS